MTTIGWVAVGDRARLTIADRFVPYDRRNPCFADSRTMARLREGRDYYYDPNGRMVLTAHFLAARGHCCGSGCRHCPYPPRTDTPLSNPTTSRDQAIEPDSLAEATTASGRDVYADRPPDRERTPSSACHPQPLLDKVA